MEHLYHTKDSKKIVAKNPQIFLEFLVEEISMETFLRVFLERNLSHHNFQIHSFQGKKDLLGKLSNLLKGYVKWLPENYRLIVIVDQDGDDCKKLKKVLEDKAKEAGLITKSNHRGQKWQIVNRIVVEELESWYFGDWNAVCKAYPRVSKNIISKKEYRNPDNIKGGVKEAFKKVMNKYGYFKNGLRQKEIASNIAQYIDPKQNSSHSFNIFWKILCELV
ncbi:MAG: DUF4276 family protein [Chitinispirillaceae bacterium]|nr:DUF4276 family protein [Chitinispirillaceae bacterium]